MTHPSTHCPNCGTAWPVGVDVCAHCGFVRAPAWPPAPTGQPPPLPPAPRLLTGAAWGDMTLGVVIGLGSNLFYGLGLVIAPILYFVLRPKYPIFTRGIGYGYLAVVALLLGAAAWCFYSVSQHGL